jgi:hypothetical protein
MIMLKQALSTHSFASLLEMQPNIQHTSTPVSMMHIAAPMAATSASCVSDIQDLCVKRAFIA